MRTTLVSSSFMSLFSDPDQFSVFLFPKSSICIFLFFRKIRIVVCSEWGRINVQFVSRLSVAERGRIIGQLQAATATRRRRGQTRQSHRGKRTSSVIFWSTEVPLRSAQWIDAVSTRLTAPTRRITAARPKIGTRNAVMVGGKKMMWNQFSLQVRTAPATLPWRWLTPCPFLPMESARPTAHSTSTLFTPMLEAVPVKVSPSLQ